MMIKTCHSCGDAIFGEIYEFRYCSEACMEREKHREMTEDAHTFCEEDVWPYDGLGG